MINNAKVKVIANRLLATMQLTIGETTALIFTEGWPLTPCKVMVKVHGVNASGEYVVSGKAKNGFDTVWVLALDGQVRAENQSCKNVEAAVAYALANTHYWDNPDSNKSFYLRHRGDATWKVA